MVERENLAPISKLSSDPYTHCHTQYTHVHTCVHINAHRYINVLKFFTCFFPQELVSYRTVGLCYTERELDVAGQARGSKCITSTKAIQKSKLFTG